MSIHPGSPWSHAGSWRGAEPRRAIRAWLIASGIGGLMLGALLLAPPVSPPAQSGPASGPAPVTLVNPR